ncbi:MAG: hypothetical protein ACE5MH_10570, partial [Terriglobia bacterium]
MSKYPFASGSCENVSPQNVYGSQFFRRSTKGSGNAAGGGESGWISQHPTNSDVFYAGSQGALITRYDRSNGQIRDIQISPRFFSGEPA